MGLEVAANDEEAARDRSSARGVGSAGDPDSSAAADALPPLTLPASGTAVHTTKPSKQSTRSATPSSTLPPLLPTPNNACPPHTPTLSSGSTTRLRSLPMTTTTYISTFPCKLTPVQIASLLKPFWSDLLANQLKSVRRYVTENHLKKIDFNTVRYAANADATPLHLCAQYGLLAMAKMLVHEFGLLPTLRNKVGSTPLHVACKMAKSALVTWLVDELHVPLDVPDNQQRLALDVAPFETVDECVLAPLRRQHAGLQQRENELLEENVAARARLDAAQLAFRQASMLLSDTESRLDHERVQIDEIRSMERHWYAQWQAQEAQLDEVMAEYDREQEELAREEEKAKDLYERDVNAVQEEHVTVQRELEELQSLVASTQHELDRRRQLLVDQLGVFDAALHEFGGSKDVQKWALATLLAIARDESGATNGHVDRTELLLRAEPVLVVRHVLATFETDYELQYEAAGVLVAILRLGQVATATTSELFVAAVVDSDLLLLLGGVLARWWGGETGEATTMTRQTFEAMYLSLGLRKNTQRLLAFCQHKPFQLMALHTIERAWRVVDSSTTATIGLCKPLLCYASLVLLTQTKYGVQKVLRKAGAVRILFESLRRISHESPPVGSEMNLDSELSTEVETLHYLLATLTLLTSSHSGSGITSKSNERSKCYEPVRLEDITTDLEFIRASTVIDCLRLRVMQASHDPNATIATLWAFKLLVNLVQHGGEAAFRVRQDLLKDPSESPRGQDPFFVLLEAMQLVLGDHAQTDCSEYRKQAALAGLDLFRFVWIERYDRESRLMASRPVVLSSLSLITAGLVKQLLVPSYKSAAGILFDAATSLDALTSAAQNPRNAQLLTTNDCSVEVTVLKPILVWTLQFIDETGTSYREPYLIALLLRVLKLFYLLAHSRRLASSEFLCTAPASDVAGLYRTLHNMSNEIGVCAVVKVFREIRALDADQPTPPEWTTLRALCIQIEDITHCAC